MPEPPTGPSWQYRMRPEARVQVRFIPAAEGGRARPIEAPWFGCPFQFQGEYFDCRLQPITPGVIPLGEAIEVLVQFLRPDLVLGRLQVGHPFALWDGRTVATGIVLELLTGAGPAPASPSANATP